VIFNTITLILLLPYYLLITTSQRAFYFKGDLLRVVGVKEGIREDILKGIKDIISSSSSSSI
jgi:hypothetical protein